MNFSAPPKDCPLCPRLAKYRHENRKSLPEGYNGAVPAFGALDAGLLIVGLAPGRKGANYTGRPFTGDYAGELLYPTLLKFGFAEGGYRAEKDDGLRLKNCRITNAVRCVPPGNKPEKDEIAMCLSFLKDEIAAMENLKIILALGHIAHKAVLRAFDLTLSHYKFGHGEAHILNGVTLIDSYHCSRYNTNTGRLTTGMFEAVFEKIRPLLSS